MPRRERWAARRVCAPTGACPVHADANGDAARSHYGSRLRTGPAFTQPADPSVQDFRKSLEALKAMKTDKLSRLMRGARKYHHGWKPGSHRLPPSA